MGTTSALFHTFRNWDVLIERLYINVTSGTGTLNASLMMKLPTLLRPDDLDINTLELWPIVASANRWGHLWSGRKICVYTDNTQVLET